MNEWSVVCCCRTWDRHVTQLALLRTLAQYGIRLCGADIKA